MRSFAIESPAGDVGSLSFVGASLVVSASRLAMRPLAVPNRGIHLASSPTEVHLALQAFRAASSRGAPFVDRCLRFSGYRHPRRIRAKEYGVLVFWDSDTLSSGFARSLSQYDKLYGISQFVADVMAEATGRDVGVIHHGVWPELCPYTPPPASGPFTFLHLGQVDERKATDQLMRAFVAAFPRGNEDVRLVIKCGPGHGERAHTWWQEHGRSDPRIEIDARHVPRQELSGYFQRCHSVVMPSRCEGFGMVGLEGLAHGRLLISSAWSGPADYASAVDCEILAANTVVPAYIYPGFARECEIDDLIDALRRVSAARDDTVRRGIAGRSRVIDEWSWVRKVEAGYLCPGGDSQARRNLTAGVTSRPTATSMMIASKSSAPSPPRAAAPAEAEGVRHGHD